jgi:hypothetical protein
LLIVQQDRAHAPSEGEESMPEIVTPNIYHLSGQQLQVTYSTSSFDGRPILTYQDTHQSKSFRGDEIRAVDCDLGTLVSVTLRVVPDVGSTSLSLFVPRMQITRGTTASVHTHCVTTLHSSRLVPQCSPGQLDTYDITDVQGTAQFVLF